MPENILTIEEIERAFANQWILIGNPETDEGHNVLRGQVLWHSANRDEVYAKLLELRPSHYAIRCTIKLPADTAIVL